MLRRLSKWICLGLTVAAFAGCKNQQATFIDPNADNFDKPTNGWGLRKLDPKDYPDMRSAWMDKTNLEQAVDRSIDFLNKPSSVHFYPSTNPGDTITHQQILASLVDFKNMIHQGITPDQFQQQILSRYDVYTSVGYNDQGNVWFTGYYTPIYYGSTTQTGDFKYPVYSRPADLHLDPITGEVIGGPYPSRSQLLDSGKLHGLEIMYFRKPIEPFIIQVQGSAKVILPDGKVQYLGYAGSNGQPHKGLGSELVKEGKIEKNHLSLPAVLAYFDAHPTELDQYVRRDDRFVFLKPYDQNNWPAGSLNERVTADRSLATDKSIFPRASLTFIDVDKPTADGGTQPYKGFTLDQDTGGAIRAAGRADIYMGIGDEAGKLAGREFAQGRLYYVFLKPDLAAGVAVPAMKQTAVPKGITTGTPKKGATPPKKGGPVPTPSSGTGGGDMFPGSVK